MPDEPRPEAPTAPPYAPPTGPPVVPVASVPLPPPPAGPPPVPAAPAPTFTPPPAPSRHRRRPLVIGAVAAIVVVVILAAVFAFGGSKSSGRRTSRPVTASDYTLNVLFCGVDRDGFASMDGFIKNRSGDDLRFNFDVAFVDRAGHTVGHGLSDTFLNAGDSSPMGAGVKVDTAATNVTCNVTVT